MVGHQGLACRIPLDRLGHRRAHHGLVVHGLVASQQVAQPGLARQVAPPSDQLRHVRRIGICVPEPSRADVRTMAYLPCEARDVIFEHQVIVVEERHQVGAYLGYRPCPGGIRALSSTADRVALVWNVKRGGDRPSRAILRVVDNEDLRDDVRLGRCSAREDRPDGVRKKDGAVARDEEDRQVHGWRESSIGRSQFGPRGAVAIGACDSGFDCVDATHRPVGTAHSVGYSQIAVPFESAVRRPRPCPELCQPWLM